MKRSVLMIIMVMLVLAGSAQQQLSLPDAINIALQNSLEIQLAKNRISADSIYNNIGYAGGLPVVTGNIADNESITSVNQKLNTGNNIQRNNAAANNLQASIGGSILLYNGGRVLATKKRFAELETQSKELLNTQVQNIMADVMIGYFDIIRQQNYIKTINLSIDASNKQLDIVKVRQSVGLANNADLFQAQIDLNTLQQSKLAQELVIGQAKAELLRLLTLNADSSITIQDTIIVEKNIVLEDILNSLYKNADIKAAENQIRINELIVKETNGITLSIIKGNLWI